MLIGKMKYTLLILLLFYITNCCAQDISTDRRDKNTIRVCFYNLENFFDYEDNPKKNDDDFTPTGKNYWTKTRFERKANNIAKVFIALGQWDLPEIIGVCEIENQKAINHLLRYTQLSAGNYKYVYYESPDIRGINVALFYKPDKFNVINSCPIAVTDSLDISFKTRDILYVKGVLNSDCQDTLHLFVNHWSSRSGGQIATMDKRNRAASILRSKIDSLLAVNLYSRILVMGDFNDYPYDESIRSYLRASSDTAIHNDGELINMMYPYLKRTDIGAYKYQNQWGILDQIIVSFGLYKSETGLRTKTAGNIFCPDFLLIEEKNNNSKKPFRTYLGLKYMGGFSDHLPVFIDLKCND